MSATIFDIRKYTDPSYSPPEFLFIDTSFLINTFVPIPEAPGFPNPFNLLCSNYLDYLKIKARKEEVCLFTADNVISEFFYYILKGVVEFREFPNAPFDSHLAQYKTKGVYPFGKIFKDHPELIKKHYGLLKQYYDLIISVPISVLSQDLLLDINTPSISELASELIKDYQILPADSFNLAVAHKAGIRDILAIDFDYHRVNTINVHTHLSAGNKKCSVCATPIT